MKYIELNGGVPYIVDRAVAGDGKTKNLPATTANFHRLAPQAAEQLRQQGAARASANATESPEAKQATADERARIQSILGLPAAKGRESLATQLALTEGMTVERAAEILSIAPAENPAFAIGPDPDEDARQAADQAIAIARRGGYVR